MGYISSGDTNNITAYLTQIGRQALLKGDKTRFKIKYFALGDDDANYLTVNVLGEGFVPDLTGSSDDCIPSIGLNIDIKNKINTN